MKQWLNEKYIREYIFEYKEIAYLFIVLPILGTAYFIKYFSAFGINYLIYFSPADPLYIFHEKVSLFLFIIIFFLFPFVGGLFFIKKDILITNKKMLFKTMKISFVFMVLIFIYNKIYYQAKTSDTLYVLLLIFVILNFMPFLKNKIYVSILGLVVFTLIIFFLAKIDAEHTIKTLKNRTYTISLKDGVDIVKENDTCNYYIRRTSNYFFVLKDCENKIEAHPVSEIKKMSFSIPKKLRKKMQRGILKK